MSLTEMLGLRPGMRVRLVHPPEGFLKRLEPLPAGVAFLDAAKTGLDLTIFFTTKKVEVVEFLQAFARGMAVTGHIWVCFPALTESSQVPTEEFVRVAGLEVGLTDDKKLMVDAGWVALRLSWKPRAPRLEKPQIQA